MIKTTHQLAQFSPAKSQTHSVRSQLRPNMDVRSYSLYRHITSWEMIWFNLSFFTLLCPSFPSERHNVRTKKSPSIKLHAAQYCTDKNYDRSIHTSPSYTCRRQLYHAVMYCYVAYHTSRRPATSVLTWQSGSMFRWSEIFPVWSACQFRPQKLQVVAACNFAYSVKV